MNQAIYKRIAELESRVIPGTCYCLVELPDGTEKEMSIGEWYEHSKEYKWLKITRNNGDENAILLILAALDNEVADRMMERGDTAAAAELTAEAARYLAKYERGLA